MTAVIRARLSTNGSWDRARLIVALVASVAVVVTAIGVIFPTNLWRVERSGAGLTFSYNEPVEGRADSRIVFKDDFSDGSGKWSVRDTDAALVELSGGGLRIVVRDEETVDFEVRPLSGDTDAIRIDAEATVLAGGDNAVFGIVCTVSAGADAPSTGGGGAYALLIEPGTRQTGIGRVPVSLDDGFELSDWLHQGTLATSRALGRTIHLRGDCSGGGSDDRRISFWVDGRSGGAGTHAAGPARFDGAGVAVYSASGSVAPDIRFDDIVVAELNP